MRRFRRFFFVVFLYFVHEMSFGQVLIPMDYEEQTDHLKAYGIAFWTLEKNINLILEKMES